MYVYMYVCVYVCMCMYVCMHMCMYAGMAACLCSYACPCVRKYVCRYVYIYVYMNMLSHRHMCSHDHCCAGPHLAPLRRGTRVQATWIARGASGKHAAACCIPAPFALGSALNLGSSRLDISNYLSQLPDPHPHLVVRTHLCRRVWGCMYVRMCV